MSGPSKIIRESLFVGLFSAAVYLGGLAVVTNPPLSEDRPAGAPGSGAALSVSAGAWYDSTHPGIPVLCHHYFRGQTTPKQFLKILGALFFNLPLLDGMDEWTQTSAVFEAQMDYLAREGYESVGLEDVAAWQRGVRELPPKAVVITIDDGDRSVAAHAYPVLKKHGFKATLFIVTSEVGRKWDRVDCLDWGELARLEETGVFSVQSHSHDLHRKVRTREGDLPVFVAAKRGLYEFPAYDSWEEAVYDDLRISRETIEQRLGREVSALAWPYGFGDASLDSVAAAAGFRVLCTLGAGSNRRIRPAAGRAPWQLMEIRRHTITARISPRSFEEILDGDFKPPR
jgi:peptidoglycan/xylan/chitin deacetylase (PgdA/CDA1 family)